MGMWLYVGKMAQYLEAADQTCYPSPSTEIACMLCRRQRLKDFWHGCSMPTAKLWQEVLL